MSFLLIDASLVLDDDGNLIRPPRQAESNGEVINELGDGSVLALEYPPGEEDDLPPFDVQFVPEQSAENVGSVEFTVTVGQDTYTITDDFAPYAVSKAEDGFFEPPPFLNDVDEPVQVRIEVDVHPEPDAGGELLADPRISFAVTADAAMQPARVGNATLRARRAAPVAGRELAGSAFR